MALLGDVLRLAVVGAERDPARAEFLDERDQCLEIPRGRGLADQEPDPGAEPLPALLDRERLVVGADPGGDICVQRAPE